MKIKNLIPLVLFLFPVVVLAQNQVITFSVDMSPLKGQQFENVGVRGSESPLSWDATYPMSDPDNDGVYAVTIKFEDVMPGDKLFYKFVYGDVVWELDLYQEAGNRSLSMLCNYYNTPLVKWDEVTQFSTEALLYDADMTILSHWLYIIGNGLQRGLTPEQIGKEYAAFFAGSFDWLESPQQWMANAHLGQAASPFGHFDPISVAEDEVEYKLRKVWGQYIKTMGKNGELMGVNEKQITAVLMSYSSEILTAKGFKFEWLDRGEYITINISK